MSQSALSHRSTFIADKMERKPSLTKFRYPSKSNLLSLSKAELAQFQRKKEETKGAHISPR